MRAINISNIDTTDNPSKVVFTITDDNSIYVNSITGEQNKITDVNIINNVSELDVTKMFTDKLYVSSDGRIYIKYADKIVDIFKTLYDSVEAIDKHIIDIVDFINVMIEREAEKTYRAALPLSHLSVGVIDPIISVKSFVFDTTKESAVLVGAFLEVFDNMVVEGTPALSISVDVYGDTGVLLDTFALDLDNKSIVILDDAKLHLLRTGYIKARVENVSSLHSDYRANLILEFKKYTEMSNLDISAKLV